MSELDESMETLNELSETLPTTQSQVSDIRVVYDSGREKVRSSPKLTGLYWACISSFRRNFSSPIWRGWTPSFTNAGERSFSLLQAQSPGVGSYTCVCFSLFRSLSVLAFSGLLWLAHTALIDIDWCGGRSWCPRLLYWSPYESRFQALKIFSNPLYFCIVL